MEELNNADIPEDIRDLLHEVDFGVLVNERSNRFASITDAEVDAFLEDLENVNTKRKTSGDMHVFTQFLQASLENRNPEDIPAPELNILLCRFILAVRKKDGSEYEPCSIRSFISSIDRHLKKKNYGKCIISDIDFVKCRETLKCKKKDLKSMGKGNKPRASTEITDENIEEMYKLGNLGSNSPSSLINSLWLVCTTNFGMRTGQETHKLRWGDVLLQKDNNDEEYLLFSQERQTKTRTGENERNIRQVKPRAYSLPGQPDKDPVHLYRLYASQRPQEALDPDAPFFLTINPSWLKPHSLWYKKNALGINSIYAIMRNMKEGTSLGNHQRITPYSVRKHLVQKLRDTGLAPNEIIQVTGHKNVNSINNYSTINPEQQKEISHLLSSNEKGLVPRTYGQSSCRSTASATVTRSPGSPSASQMYAGSTSYSASHSQSRNFLSSIMTGNSIYGNVTINVTPEVMGVHVCSDSNQSEKGKKRALDE